MKKFTVITIFFSVLLFLAISAGTYFWYTDHQKKTASQELAKIYQLDNKDEKLSKYLKLHEKYPKTPAGHTASYQAGCIYFEKEEYDKTIEVLKECSSLEDPMIEKERFYILGQAYTEQKSYEEARISLEKAAEKESPRRYLYLELLGNTHEQLGNKQMARKCYQQVCDKCKYTTNVDYINRCKKNISRLSTA